MKTAVILMNLGTPTEPTAAGVRTFLKEFLSDPRVVEVPRVIWWCILNLIILPLRSPRVAKLYQEVWENGESPLRLITQRQTTKLKQLLSEKLGGDAPVVEYAMTYCGPRLMDVVSKLEAQGIEHITVLPLFPQYSATTTGSIYDQVTNIVSRSRNIPQIHVVKHYSDNASYIDALAHSIQDHWNQHEQSEYLLMSYHGLPQKFTDEGDPYYIQCKKTSRCLADKLGLSDSQWKMSFQSRLGYAKWLSPYTSEVLEQWGQEKVRSVDVVCPAFSADCLETLEEIKIQNRELFQASGGGDFHLIPCLNDQSVHIEMMASIVEMYLPKTKD